MADKMGERNLLKEETLKEEGWVKQNTIGEPRLSELVELYESMGFEVHLEPLNCQDEECTACFAHEGENVKTIYTRQKSKGSTSFPFDF